MLGQRAERSIVRSELDVKGWQAALPSVEAARPGRCPACGGAGAEPGRQKGLRGHGLRERQFRGPLSPGAPPTLVVLRIRRYRCQPCGAVVTVAPRETAAGRLYTLGAIAWALALLGASEMREAHVRERTSPWRIVGASAARRWITLRRWVAAIRARRLFSPIPLVLGLSSLRDASAQIAVTLSAYALAPTQGLPLPARSFLGAVRAA